MLRAALLASAVVASTVPALADFQFYPGARPDAELQQAVEDAAAELVEDAAAELGEPAEGEMELFVSADPVEDVLAFYRPHGQEYQLPAMPGLWGEGYERDLPAEIRFGANGIETVPSGIRVKQAYILLDGAADLEHAKAWVGITQPMVLQTDTDGTRITYGDVRDITAIVRVQK